VEKTTWQIHTMGGPIHRIFSTVENAIAWARQQWREDTLVIEAHPGLEGGGPVSYAIRYEADAEPWATIGERRHCATCAHITGVRSDVDGDWTPMTPDYLVPKDFEGETR